MTDRICEDPEALLAFGRDPAGAEREHRLFRSVGRSGHQRGGRQPARPRRPNAKKIHSSGHGKK